MPELKCTKNKEQPMNSGWRNYSGPPGREGRDRTSHIMCEVASFCQQRLIRLTSTRLTNQRAPGPSLNLCVSPSMQLRKQPADHKRGWVC